MSKKIYLPESMYYVDSKMSLRKVARLFVDNTPITGRVIRLNSKEKHLVVDLGGQLQGIIPFSEVSIYPIYKQFSEDDFSFSPTLYTLVGKTIRAKIRTIKNTIVLSRKEHMLEALEELKYIDEFPKAVITNFSRVSAFMDIGAGITGKITAAELSYSFFNYIQELGLSIGNVIPVKSLGFDSEMNKFELSRILCLPTAEEALNIGDIVECIISNYVEQDSEITGYFVSILGYLSGILDSPIPLEYGETVSGIVSKITSKGIKLKLVHK